MKHIEEHWHLHHLDPDSGPNHLECFALKTVSEVDGGTCEMKEGGGCLYVGPGRVAEVRRRGDRGRAWDGDDFVRGKGKGRSAKGGEK